MLDYNPYEWCQRNGWTDVRQIENSIWVAFPPGGVIETPLPEQFESTIIDYKTNKLQNLVDIFILITITIFAGIIVIIISPLFIVPLCKNCLAKRAK